MKKNSSGSKSSEKFLKYYKKSKVNVSKFIKEKKTKEMKSYNREKKRKNIYI